MKIKNIPIFVFKGKYIALRAFIRRCQINDLCFHLRNWKRANNFMAEKEKD